MVKKKDTINCLLRNANPFAKTVCAFKCMSMYSVLDFCMDADGVPLGSELNPAISCVDICMCPQIFPEDR